MNKLSSSDGMLCHLILDGMNILLKEALMF